MLYNGRSLSHGGTQLEMLCTGHGRWGIRDWWGVEDFPTLTTPSNVLSFSCGEAFTLSPSMYPLSYGKRAAVN